MATLPAAGRGCCVGPPLSASGPSSGSMPTMLPLTPLISGWPMLSSTTLWVAEFTWPSCLKFLALVPAALLSARTELVNSPITGVKLPNSMWNRPPPSLAVLLAMVTLTMRPMLS